MPNAIKNMLKKKNSLDKDSDAAPTLPSKLP
jgi:hypothetical protein